MQSTSSNSLSLFFFNLGISILVLASLMPLTSCSTKNTANQDVLFHVIGSKPFSSLDPSVEQADGVNILKNVYETLTVYDSKEKQIKPCLAESWTSNATKTEWTFNLRKDVLFHDGTPLTAAAVKKSIDRVMFLGKGASYIWDCVSSLEAQNAHTVVFRLNYAADLPLIASSNSAAYILSSACASKDESWFNKGNDAGSGPYRIAAVSRTSVALQAFEAYRDGWQKGKFKKIFIEEVPRQERLDNYMKKGEADIVFLPDSQKSSSLSNYRLDIGKTWQSTILMFNTEKAPCSSEDFRKALAYSFPYREAVEEVMKGHASYAEGMVPEGLLPQGLATPSYRFDQDKAREHLRRSEQENVTLTLSYHINSKELTKLLELYRKNLEAIGINLILMKTDRDEQQKMARNPNPEERQDILLMNWWPDNADPAGSFKLLLSDQGLDKGFNYCYLHAPEITLALQIASILALENQEEAIKIYRSLQQKVYDHCYLVFLYNEDISIATRKDIRGVTINPAYASCIYYYSLMQN